MESAADKEDANKLQAQTTISHSTQILEIIPGSKRTIKEQLNSVECLGLIFKTKNGITESSTLKGANMARIRATKPF